jgi:hypothetical protein
MSTWDDGAIAALVTIWNGVQAEYEVDVAQRGFRDARNNNVGAIVCSVARDARKKRDSNEPVAKDS